MRLKLYDLDNADRVCLMVNMYQPITLLELNREINFDLPDCMWVGMEKLLEIGKKDHRMTVKASANGYIFSINRYNINKYKINPEINILSNVNSIQL